MKIIISPAKKMNVDTDTLSVGQLPHFMEEARCLMDYMKKLSYGEAKKIWSCNDKLAELNYERFRHMNLERGLTPAILSYEGIQYQYMAPLVMEEEALGFLEEHLRILSGFYGVLRPFDGVTPYRLEMQAKFDRALSCRPLPEEHSHCSNEGGQGLHTKAEDGIYNLYQFWGSRLYEFLEAEELAGQSGGEIGDGKQQENSWILNLASKEYSRCISPYIKGKMHFVTCVFGQWVEGKVKEKGTLAKMARGEMVRFLAENQITDVEGVKGFKGLGYEYKEELSDGDTLVFVKAQDFK